MAAKGKGKNNGNGNIMSFFKKAESTGVPNTVKKEDEESLFLEESPVKQTAQAPFQIPTPPRDDYPSDRDFDFKEEESPISRFNEDSVPSKRVKLDDTASPNSGQSTKNISTMDSKGPFADDSDSEEDATNAAQMILLQTSHDEHLKGDDSPSSGDTPLSNHEAVDGSGEKDSPPRLKREATSIGDVNEFEGVDDFIDDEFPEEGEEYIERRWMEEQAELEMGLEEEDTGDAGPESENLPQEIIGAVASSPDNPTTATCPICGGSTAGLAEQVSKCCTYCS